MDFLTQALRSAWIQPAGARGLMEFIERIRWEVAKVDGPNVLSPAHQNKVRQGALRATRTLLAGDLPDSARLVLLTMHVALADAGIADDLALVAVSVHLRAEYGRKTAEPIARRAVEIAAPLGDRNVLAQARAELVITLLRHSDVAVFEEAGSLLEETCRSVDGTALTPVARFKVAHATMERFAHLGDRRQALNRARERARIAEESFGDHHRHTLSALADVAFNAMRVGDVRHSIEVRRDLLARRRALAGDLGLLQTAGASNNLVTSLLELDDDSVIGEAVELAAESVLLRSRAFGLDGRVTQSSRLNRVRTTYRRGLARERSGGADAARADFLAAEGESAQIVHVRLAANPGHGPSHCCAVGSRGLASGIWNRWR